MVDGQVGSLLAMLVGLVLILSERKRPNVAIAGAALALALLVTTKFTGVVYAVVLGVGLLTILVLTRVDRRAIVRTAASGALAALLAFAFTGFNPYVTNTIGWGSPFHPVYGPHAIDVMGTQPPANLAPMNRLSRVWYAVFGVANNRQGPDSRAILKVPLTVGRREIKPYLNPDTRIAGFGPLFSGALLLSIVLGLALLGERQTRSDVRVRRSLAVAVVVGLSVFATSEGWWARVAPQLWLVPLVIAAIAAAFGASGRTRVASATVLALVIVNAAFVGTTNFANQVRGRTMIEAKLDGIKTSGSRVMIQQGVFDTTHVLLREHGIDYTIMETDTVLPGSSVIPYTTTRVYRTPVE